jgi:transcriptional regulator with XRE-family HTH domain
MERGISQMKWAEAAGVQQSQVSRWENAAGEGEPSIDSLRGIAKHLGTTVAALIGDEKPEFAAPREPDPNELTVAMLGKFGLDGTRLDAIKAVLNAEYAPDGKRLDLIGFVLEAKTDAELGALTLAMETIKSMVGIRADKKAKKNTGG